MTPRQARPGHEHSHQQPRRSLANTKVTCVRSLSSSLYKTSNVRGKDAVLATATKRASAEPAGQLLREVHNTVWGWQFVGVASLCPKQQFSKRLMRTGMRLQSGHSQKTAHTRPTSTMLLFPLSSTPHDLPGRRDFSVYISTPLLHRVAVLPRKAPSRVIALASARQPYSPLIACARARPLADAPPFHFSLECLCYCVTGSRAI